MTTFSEEQWRMLYEPFDAPPGRTELIGVEIEAGVVDPHTGVSRPYRGPGSVAGLLEAIASEWNATTTRYGSDLIGAVRSDGAGVGPESGCALEYTSKPEASLATLVDKVEEDLHSIAQTADRLGLALLAGALLPFDRPHDFHWAPKPRIPLMLEHFAREVGPNSEGPAAMAQILTVQTTLDYLDSDDLARKNRVLNLVSPVVAAMFVNSPVRHGRAGTLQSERMLVWERVDPARVGVFEHMIAKDFAIDDHIAWLCSLPMIYRWSGDMITAAPHQRPFRDFLLHGYGDGTWPDPRDWRALLGTTWPHVRPRNTIEVRIADGPNRDAWSAAPAIWTALAYDRLAAETATDLLAGYTVQEHRAAINDVARRGLAATIGTDRILDLARDLLAIVTDGLTRRVIAGLEPPKVLSYLDPLAEIVGSGISTADRLLAQWDSRWRDDPAAYVTEFRYR